MVTGTASSIGFWRINSSQARLAQVVAWKSATVRSTDSGENLAAGRAAGTAAGTRRRATARSARYRFAVLPAEGHVVSSMPRIRALLIAVRKTYRDR